MASKFQLILPMVFYVFYICSIGILNFRTRFRSVRDRSTNLKYFKTYASTEVSDRVLVVGRHYDNQFELPMMFLIGGVAHLAAGQYNMLTVILAWSFVVFRIVHSAIHLGNNKVIWRAGAFALGFFTTLAIWLQLALNALAS